MSDAPLTQSLLGDGAAMNITLSHPSHPQQLQSCLILETSFKIGQAAVVTWCL